MDSPDDVAFGLRLAAAVRAAREEQGLSAAALADRSGVSRAMISRIELCGANPTAALLAKLSGALRLTLSELIARAEGPSSPIARYGEQPTWTDPSTGYRRRTVSPGAPSALQLVEVELPAGATVSFDADAYRFIEQQLWVLDGTLAFREGEQHHLLIQGDCLTLGPPSDCTFSNPSATTCRYLVAITRRAG